MYPKRILKVASAVSVGLFSLNNLKQNNRSLKHDIKLLHNDRKLSTFPGLVSPKLYAWLPLSDEFNTAETRFKNTTGINLHFPLANLGQRILHFGEWYSVWNCETMSPKITVEHITPDSFSTSVFQPGFLRYAKNLMLHPKELLKFNQDSRIPCFDITKFNDRIVPVQMAAERHHRWLIHYTGDYVPQMLARHNSNIAPMYDSVRRTAWEPLERCVEWLTKVYAAEAMVLTGPLFIYDTRFSQFTNVKSQAQPNESGVPNMKLPTHFFKIVILKTPANENRLYSFLVPNKDADIPIGPVRQPDHLEDNKQYLCPIHVIEHYLGHTFFTPAPRAFQAISPHFKDHNTNAPPVFIEQAQGMGPCGGCPVGQNPVRRNTWPQSNSRLVIDNNCKRN